MLETYYTKERLKEIGIKKDKYFYTITDSSTKRGYNRTITVYAYKKNLQPLCIGEKHVNTASYKGDKPTAVGILKEIFNYKTDGYMLLNKKIDLFSI